MATNTAAKIGIEIGAAFAGSFKSVFGQANSEVGKLGNSISQIGNKLSNIDAFKKLTNDTKQAGYAWQAAKVKVQELSAAIDASGAPTKKQAAELRKAEQAAERAGNAFARQREKLAEMRVGLEKSGVSTKNLTTEQQKLERQLQATQLRMESMAKTRSGMDRGKSMMADAGMAIGAVTAAAATAGLPIVQAARFEKAMLGVAKQVEGARDEGGKLTAVYYDMEKQVKLLGREIPLTTNNLAEMVAAGARMGVAKDELIDFTKTAATMAFAFELPAGELAEQMGKIAGLYKIPIPAIGSLADTINYLDDNAISKGGDIVDYLTRVGGVAGAVKITGQEMAALGSTLLTLGERTETASTATNAMFQKFAAADKGTKKFKEAMQEIGLATAEIQKGMQVDAQGTLLQVLEAIQKLPEEKRLGVMVELVGLEHSDTMAKLVGNVEEYRKQIALAGSDKAQGSMGREFAAQLATTSAQWEIAKNRITEVSVNLGTVLLPAVNAVLGGLGNLTSGIADFVARNETLVGNIAAVVGTIGGIFAASKIAAFGIGLITFAFNALKLAMMTNPIGLALTALTVAGVLLWKNWDGVKGGLVEIWETMKDAGNAAANWLSQIWTTASEAVSAGFDVMKSAGQAVIGWFRENPWAQAMVPIVGAGIYLADNWDVIKSRMATIWAVIRDTAIEAFNAIKTSVGAVIDWLAEKTAWIFQTVDKVKAAANSIGDGIGGAWSGAKSLVGLGPDAPKPAASAATAPMAAPVVATGANVTQTNQPTYNITVQGSATDPNATAKAIRAEMERREREQAATRRAMMTDKLGY